MLGKIPHRRCAARQRRASLRFGILVVPSATPLVTRVDGGTATFTIALSAPPRGPAATVTIELSSSDATEGTVSPGSVSFSAANWNVPQTVTVTGVDDRQDNPEYTIITVPATSSDPAYDGLNADDVKAQNFTGSGIIVTPSATPLVTTVDGGTATFTIRLSGPPVGGNVTIALSSSDTTEGTVSPSSVAFTTANWQLPRMITVTGVDDDDDNPEYLKDAPYTASIKTQPASATCTPPTASGNASTDPTVIAITCTPTACVPQCGARSCGVDPVCGASCGTCAGDQACGQDGRCTVEVSFEAIGLPPGAPLALHFEAGGVGEDVTLFSSDLGPVIAQKRLALGDSYATSITQQPIGATCQLSPNASGDAGSDDIQVAAICTPDQPADTCVTLADAVGAEMACDPGQHSAVRDQCYAGGVDATARACLNEYNAMVECSTLHAGDFACTAQTPYALLDGAQFCVAEVNAYVAACPPPPPR